MHQWYYDIGLGLFSVHGVIIKIVIIEVMIIIDMILIFFNEEMRSLNINLILILILLWFLLEILLFI